jgi:hypothetical protein
VAQPETVRVPENAGLIDVHHNRRRTAAEAYPAACASNAARKSRCETLSSIAANITVAATLFNRR